MDEELKITTEEVVVAVDTEIVETAVNITEEEIVDVSTTETDVVVSVEESEIIEILVEEGLGYTAGQSGLHDTLPDRNNPGQHEISAIAGLREELDFIESPRTIYSDGTNVANYYKWESGAYDEHGYFVSLASDSTIKICERSDIFGVTVDAAGFVGNQDTTVPRDNSYALVVTSGLVDVRCESTGEFAVSVGDYVVSNGHGIAEKTTSGCGYKVIDVNNKQGTLYASISLGVQACTTDLMGKQIQILDKRMDDAEINIGAAMNVANDAYNKSVESNAVSEEAIINALEALAKANGAVDATDVMNKIIESADNTAAQAKAIAEGAVTEAEAIRKEAYDTANDALSSVNTLIEDLEPISQWGANDEYIVIDTWDESDKDIAQTYYVTDTKLYYYYYNGAWVSMDEIRRGAEYLTTYIEDDLATKIEVNTVEKLTEENKAWIKKNAESISTIVSSVDKYSVGEYSQAYGLTLEQARSILKQGMVYIPTKHGDVATHSEDYEGSPTRQFTNGFYYEWATLEDGSVTWSEEIGEVWFGIEQPAGSRYTYWYDSNKLYLLKDGEWTEVATLAGNVNNRITSMIRQGVDEVRAEVVNARGSTASLGARISDTESLINSTVTWVSGDDTSGKLYNISTIDQSANNDGSSMALVVNNKDGENEVINGASIVLNSSEKGSYIQMDADKIDFKAGTLKIDANNIDFTAEDFKLDANKIDFTAEDFTLDSDNIKFSSGIGGRNYVIGGKGNVRTGFFKNFDSVTDEYGTAWLTSYGAINTNNSVNFVHLEDGFSLGCREYEVGRTMIWSYDIMYMLYELPDANADGIVGQEFWMGQRYRSSSTATTSASGAWRGVTKHNMPRVGENGCELKKWYHVEQVITIPEPADESIDTYETCIKLYSGSTELDKGAQVRFRIKNVKLEYGNIATDWTPAPEDTVGTNQVGTEMNWRMLPEKCVWWNNLTTETDPLMKLDANGLYVQGEVVANSGKIGELHLSEDGDMRITTGTFGLYSGGYEDTDVANYLVPSVVQPNHTSPVRFYAGTSLNHVYKGNVDINGACTGPSANSDYVEYSVTWDASSKIGTNNILIGYSEYSLVKCNLTYKTGAQTISAKQSGNLYIWEYKKTVNLSYDDYAVDATGTIVSASGSASIPKSYVSVTKSTSAPYTHTIAISWSSNVNSGPVTLNATIYCSRNIKCKTTSSTKDEGGNIIFSGYAYAPDNSLTVQQWTSNFTHSAVIHYTYTPKTKPVEIGEHATMILDDGSMYTDAIKISDKCYIGDDNYIGLNTSGNAKLTGTWYANSSNVITSWRDAKYDIEALDDRYSVLFDNIVPRRFKYLDGESGRYHTGVVLDELKSAMDTAELDSSEVAAYCVSNNETGDGGVRYEELVSLCINEIQKLKARIVELEAKMHSGESVEKENVIEEETLENNNENIVEYTDATNVESNE